MDDVHGTHSTTGVVKHPFLLLVQVDFVLLAQFTNNVVDDGASVIAVGTDSRLRDLVQMLRVEDVELLETCIEVAVERGEEGQEDGEETEGAHGEAAAAGALCGLLLAGRRRGRFGGHDGRSDLGIDWKGWMEEDAERPIKKS